MIDDNSTIEEINGEIAKVEVLLKNKKLEKDNQGNILKRNRENIDIMEENIENVIPSEIISEAQKEIIERWRKNVKGEEADTSSKNQKHCGKEGHWLEEAMGIKPNGKNEPDILGYEMKKESKKISFGDWSAEQYLFTKDKKITAKLYRDELSKHGLKMTGNKKVLKERFEKYCSKNNIVPVFPSSRDKLKKLNGKDVKLSRKQFIESFGTPNENKNNRYSWSGKCFPNVHNYNGCGQKITINENKDIIIKYCYKYDKRDNQEILLNLGITENEEISISIWSKGWLQKKVEDKFNQKGFFICKKSGNLYNKICFGGVINYSFFIEQFKNGKIILDSGMYQGNGRNYSQFRADGKMWHSLITEEYQ